ncbi:hypothetical protein ACHAXT_011071 [Thalassiosira profunda]
MASLLLASSVATCGAAPGTSLLRNGSGGSAMGPDQRGGPPDRRELTRIGDIFRGFWKGPLGDGDEPAEAASDPLPPLSDPLPRDNSSGRGWGWSWGLEGDGGGPCSNLSRAECKQSEECRLYRGTCAHKAARQSFKRVAKCARRRKRRCARTDDCAWDVAAREGRGMCAPATGASEEDEVEPAPVHNEEAPIDPEEPVRNEEAPQAPVDPTEPVIVSDPLHEFDISTSTAATAASSTTAASTEAASTEASTTAAASTTQATTTTASTATALTTNTPKPAKHYPAELDGVRQCVFDDGYPDSYLVTTYATLLFDDAAECCVAYDVCPVTTAAPDNTNDTNGGTAKEVFWYPELVDGVPTSCVQNNLYPDDYLEDELKGLFLFYTRGLCCHVHPAACLEPLPMRWYPSIDGESVMCVLGDDYPQRFMDAPEGHLFETQGECCAFFGVCEGGDSDAAPTTMATTVAATTTLTTQTATTEAVTTAATSQGSTTGATSAAPDDCAVWHISSTQDNTCTNAGDHPAEWDELPEMARQYYFYDSAEQCCAGSGFGDDCIKIDSCDTTATQASEAPWPSCPFHLHVDEHQTCTNSNYPAAWEGNEHMLFRTAEECCNVRFPGQPCAVLEEGCTDPSTTTQASEAPWPTCPFHLHVDEHQTCTNSEYPPAWDDMEHMLFRTAEECCNARFPGQPCAVLEEGCEQDPWPSCPWHLHLDEHQTCTNSDHPVEWSGNEHMLFRTAQECCETRFLGQECTVVDEGCGAAAPPAAVTTQAATVAVTTTARAVKWWPAELNGVRQCVSNDDYPEAYVGTGQLLSDSESVCCQTYLAVLGADCGTSHPTVPGREAFWYPHIVEGTPTHCLRDNEYPDAFLHYPTEPNPFLFSSEEGCCAGHPAACLGNPKPVKWFTALVDDSMRCVEGDDWPDSYLGGEGMLFESEGECCEAFPVCEEQQGDDEATTQATTQSGPPKSEFWWPVEPQDGGLLTCEYSSQYPDSLLQEASTTLFLTHFDCCKAYSACPDKWFPMLVAGAKMCVFGSEYSHEVLAQESQEECCGIYGCDDLSQGEGEVERPPFWWPVEPQDGLQLHCEYSSDYPEAFFTEESTTLFNTEHACCSAYHACPEHWYPFAVDGVPSCVHGANYPAEYLDNAEFRESFFYETQRECCDAFPSACAFFGWHPVEGADGTSECEWGRPPAEWAGRPEYIFESEEECCDKWCGSRLGTVSTVEAGNGAVTTTFSETIRRDPCTDCVWHEDVHAGRTCSNSGSYPSVWDEDPSARSWFFFRSAEECCLARYPDDCNIEDVTQDGAEITGRDPCTDCVWHEDVHASRTCSNSGAYPSVWDDDPSARSWFFFRSAEECCLTRYPDDCNIEDVTQAGDFSPLGPSEADDFEGVQGLPWDFGEPAQWQVSDERSTSGSYAVSNLPVSGLGTTADLVLKIIVPAPSIVSCKALIGTSMPYDHFSLVVNGEPRNMYHQPVDGWIPVTTGVAPGKNTLIFRVQNADFEHNTGDERLEMFGTGRVWLDDCTVTSVSA